MSSWTAEPFRAASRPGEPADGAGAGLLSRLARALTGPRPDREERRLYRATVRELSRLNDRELDDIGIGRWQIRDVAMRAVREQELRRALP